MNNETKQCQNCKQSFTIEPDDFSFYEKIQVPPPTWCPECRLIRRLARRNERSFHHRECEKCSKKIISVFAEDSGIHVYCSACWWSDSWDGITYGTTYDPARPFLTQLEELFHRVPIMNLFGLFTTCVNSEHINMGAWLKNCYMITYSDHGENLVHGSFVNHSKDSVDNLMGLNLELCYETVNCNRCYRAFFSVDCESSNNIWFSKNCSGCANCFGCVNLRNKNYHIFNEPYSKSGYEKKLTELYTDTHEKIAEMQERVEKLWLQHPQKYFHGWRNVRFSGDYMGDSKNAKDCFIGFKIEDSKFCSWITGPLTDSYDLTNFGFNSSFIYETLQSGDQAANVIGSWWAANCQNVTYSKFCAGSKNLFGCVGLKKHEYCILNTQYTKEEYEKLRAEIVAKMKHDRTYGSFFPIETSPFGYNETTAQEFFPLTKEQALVKGYQWRDGAKRNYEIRDDVMACEHRGQCNDNCTEAFRIHPYEQQFLESMKLPTPFLCPQCRHYRRIRYRNPLKLWHRQCMCAGALLHDRGNMEQTYQNTAKHFHGDQPCPNEFETSYAPERKEIIYCEQCYQQEVV